jgi:hypothetical protein
MFLISNNFFLFSNFSFVHKSLFVFYDYKIFWLNFLVSVQMIYFTLECDSSQWHFKSEWKDLYSGKLDSLKPWQFLGRLTSMS